jgi:hypothetical protein
MTDRERRRNAPLRPRRPATGVPDLLFAFGMCLLVMAFVFFAASFTNEDLSAGDAGTDLARIFSGTLFISALCAFAMGTLLLRDDRDQLDHYVTPLIVGAAIGGLEATAFLNPSGPLGLLAPFLLFIFVFRPVRRAVSRLAGRPAAGRS